MESQVDAGGRFAGRVAIVTGASRDPSIGRATALRLAREGARVVINGRESSPVEATLRALHELGCSARAVVGSADDRATARELAQTARAEFGRLDHVVNTVGGNRFLGAPRELERETLRETIELNTWSPLVVIQEALEAGLADGGGAIVNISSGTVYKTTPKMIAYAAAKSALNAMTRTLARDLAASGVRVNAVAPGFTQTDGTRAMWEPDDGVAASRNLLLGRLTQAEDIAAGCAFLLSDDARQITGQILDVDAGNHLMGGGWTPMTDETIQGRMR